MIYSEARPGTPALIGKVGENGHMAVRFRDSAAVLNMYPDADVYVLHQKPGAAAAYRVDDLYVSVENGIVCWCITAGDTETAGRGKCEIVFSRGGVIAKSMIYETLILPALEDGAEPPEAPLPWNQDVVIGRVREMQAGSGANPIAIYDATVGSGYGAEEDVWTDDDGTHVARITVLRVTTPDGYSVKAGDLILAMMTENVIVGEYSFFGLDLGGDDIEEHIIMNIGRTEYPAGTVMFRKDQVYMFRAKSTGMDAGFDIIWGP